MFRIKRMISTVLRLKGAAVVHFDLKCNRTYVPCLCLVNLLFFSHISHSWGFTGSAPPFTPILLIILLRSHLSSFSSVSLFEPHQFESQLRGSKDEWREEAVRERKVPLQISEAFFSKYLIQNIQFCQNNFWHILCLYIQHSFYHQYGLCDVRDQTLFSDYIFVHFLKYLF